MFEFTKNVLLGGQFKLGKEGIMLLGQQVSLLPTTTLALLCKQMTDVGQAPLLYRMSADGIPPFVQTLKRQHVVEVMPLIKLMAEISFTAGWGETKLIEYKEKEHKYTFTTSSGPIPRIIKKAEKEVCHMTRGIINGSMREIVNDSTLEGIETKCVARGAPLCKFVIQPKKSFDAATLKEFGWQIK